MKELQAMDRNSASAFLAGIGLGMCITLFVQLFFAERGVMFRNRLVTGIALLAVGAGLSVRGGLRQITADPRKLALWVGIVLLLLVLFTLGQFR
jgi:hypothetical protein